MDCSAAVEQGPSKAAVASAEEGPSKAAVASQLSFLQKAEASELSYLKNPSRLRDPSVSFVRQRPKVEKDELAEARALVAWATPDVALP